VAHVHQRGAGGQHGEQAVDQPARRGERPVQGGEDAVAGGEAQRGGPVPRAGDDAGDVDAGEGGRVVGDGRERVEVVAVHPDLGGVVDAAGGQRPAGPGAAEPAAEGVEREADDQPRAARHVRSLQRVLGGQHHVGARGIGDGLGAAPPQRAQRRRRLPVRREQHGHRRPRRDVALVAQQVGRLGHPVAERGAGELDALAGRVVVEGDQRAGGVGGEQGAEEGVGDGHRPARYSTQGTPSAVMAGWGGGTGEGASVPAAVDTPSVPVPPPPNVDVGGAAPGPS
jgi:hypothetical protein